jgi:predicted ATPase/class 3 adenylate cyclase
VKRVELLELEVDDEQVRELPTGRVTFLFTDIEGSTRLIEELGEEGYVEALGEHRRLLRGAFAAHGGVEVDTQGDAFLYAFADPAEALAAAADGQDALASGSVKVRIGLHTGEPRLTGEGYAGRELHRAARVAACGHGGQVVVSAATRAFVDGELTELGEHRLKDFPEPVSLFQLGSERFPPLKTISNTNLPRPASSFVGRERELAELVSMLSDGTRLLTLSGPGGSGKTRLAVEVASELVPAFKAGVFWVPLATLRDPALVSETIAQVLGAKDGLAEHIEERELLLLLDNLEQVVEAAPALGELLESCPNLKLLVTSRELLRIRGEVEYPVPPLAEPEAVELFCQRSRLEPDETIAELCRRLDDLPLALELAAARTSVLSPGQILERLSQRLDLLKGGRDAEARQQTLRATIEWSHELLTPEEQTLFARLAVFRGGCTLEAAEQVAGADLDTLQSLVDKSLVRHTVERFWMLETIRAYARERLAASGEEAELRRRHALSVLDFAGATVLELDEGGDQAAGYRRFDAEQDNLRAALEWARDSREDEVLLRLVAAVAMYWRSRGFSQELDMWLDLALERGSSPAQARMWVLRAADIRASSKRDWARSEALIAEWRRIAEQEGDERQVLMTLNAAALNALEQGDFDNARAQLIEIGQRAAEIGDGFMAAFATVNLGLVALRLRNFRAGLDYSGKAAELFRERGDDGGVAVALENCGWSSLGLSNPARAAEYFREAIAVVGRVGATRTGLACTTAFGLAASLIALHEEERGVQLLGAAASLREELGIGFEDEDEHVRHDQAVADAKEALGEEAFAAAWARGEAMTPEEIVAFCAATTDANDADPAGASRPLRT